MNRILNTALLALAAGLQAGLPTAGLPSGNADVAVHISNETVDQTQIGAALTAAFQAEVDANAIVATLKKELGFELDEDFRDLTVAGNASNEKSFVALVRGKFNKARIEAYASSNSVPSRTVSGLKAWDLRALGEAIAKSAGTQTSNRDANVAIEVVIVDGNTIVIAETSNVERALAAVTNATPWKHDGLSSAAASVQNGWLLISADVAAIEAAAKDKRKASADASPEAKASLSKRSGAKVVTVALGENTSDVTLRVHADFVDEAAAKKSVSDAKGMLGFGAMLTMPAESDNADAAAKKANAADLLRRITITQNGAAADANLDYPIQKVAQMILDAAKSRREKTASGK